MNILEGLRGSSVLFSKDFDKENNFYLRSDFINHLYHYHKKRGLASICTQYFTELFFSLATFLSLMLLIFCIDYQFILDVKNGEKINMWEMFNTSKIYDGLGIFVILCVIYAIHFIIKCVHALDVILLNHKIKYFLKRKLDDNESEICNLSWDELLNKLQLVYNNDNINPYTIASRIQIGENILLGLFDKGYFDYMYICTLLEWNIKYCLLNSLFKRGMKLNHEFITNTELSSSTIKRKFRVISIINFIAMPVLIIHLIFTKITFITQKIYQKPGSLFEYTWTKYSKWNTMAYNELENDYKQRQRYSLPYLNNYIKSFVNPVLINLFGLLKHILSNIFCLLVILSIINPAFLFHVYFIGDRNIFWILGIIGTSISILGNCIKKDIQNSPSYYIIESSKKGIYFTENQIKKAHKNTTQKYVSRLINMEIMDFIYSIYYTLLTPFHLWNISFNIENIVYFVKHNMVKHKLLGWVMEYSVFEKKDIYSVSDKTKISIQIFKNKYENNYI